MRIHSRENVQHDSRAEYNLFFVCAFYSKNKDSIHFFSFRFVWQPFYRIIFYLQAYFVDIIIEAMAKVTNWLNKFHAFVFCSFIHSIAPIQWLSFLHLTLPLPLPLVKHMDKRYSYVCHTDHVLSSTVSHNLQLLENVAANQTLETHSIA